MKINISLSPMKTVGLVLVLLLASVFFFVPTTPVAALTDADCKLIYDAGSPGYIDCVYDAEPGSSTTITDADCMLIFPDRTPEQQECLDQAESGSGTTTLDRTDCKQIHGIGTPGYITCVAGIPSSSSSSGSSSGSSSTPPSSTPVSSAIQNACKASHPDLGDGYNLCVAESLCEEKFPDNDTDNPGYRNCIDNIGKTLEDYGIDEPTIADNYKEIEAVKNNPIFGLMTDFLNFLTAGVGLVVTTLIVVGGIQYMTAGGNPQKTQAAIMRISNALIGLVLYILMFAILQWLIPGGIFG